ncbi:MAG: PAS domain S-box protein [Bacteroidota bacterium]
MTTLENDLKGLVQKAQQILKKSKAQGKLDKKEVENFLVDFCSCFELPGNKDQYSKKKFIENLLVFFPFPLAILKMNKKSAGFLISNVNGMGKKFIGPISDGKELLVKIFPGLEKKVSMKFIEKKLLKKEKVEIKQFSLNENLILNLTFFALPFGYVGLAMENQTILLQNQKLLKESEERFRTGFHTSPDSMLLTALAGKTVVDVNDCFCRMSGYSREELLNMNLDEFDFWKDKDQQKRFMERLMIEKTILNEEAEFVKKDGSVITGLISVSLILVQDKPHILSVTKDFTSKKKDEIKIKESEEMFRGVAENSPNIIYISQEGRILYANKQCEEILGYKRKELYSSGFNFLDLIINPSPSVKKYYLEHVRGKEKGGYEHVLVKKNGEKIYVQDNSKLISYRGNPAILGVVTDITRIELVKREIKNSEERLQLALQGTDLALWDWNISTDQMVVNERWDEMVGSGSVEKINSLQQWKKIVHEEDLPLVIEKIESHINGETPFFESEYRIRSKDKGWIWILARGKLLEKDGKGNPLRMVGTLLDITRRKEFEKALSIKEENYRHIFNATTDAIFIHDKVTGEIIDVNQAMLDMFGFSTMQEIGDPEVLAAGFSPYTSIDALNYIKKAINEGPQLFEWLSRKKTGELFWTEISLKNVEIGGESRILAAVRNINDRMKMEQALMESEEKYKAAFKTSPDGVGITSLRDGLFIELNDGYSKLSGYSMKEMLGKSLNELSFYVNPSDRDKIIKKLNKDGTVENYEFLFKRKDGEKRVGLMSVNKISFRNDDFLLSVTKDITDIKSAREGLKRIFELSPDLICVSTLDGIFKNVNPAFEKILGYSPGDFLNQSMKKFILEEDIALLEKTKEKITGKDPVISMENRYICKDGSIKWISWISKVITGENLIYAVGRDVTEEKKAKEDLIRAKEKAEESDRLKSAFLANMSHEIRTPMNGIIGFAELLEEKNLPDQKRERYVNVIKSRGADLLHIINDILDISKLEAGQIEIRPEFFSLNELMDNLYTYYFQKKQKENRGNLEFMLVKEFSSINIYADESRINQVLTNLVDNSYKFTEEGQVEFGYKVHHDVQEIIFFVKDTGIGISKKELNHVFDKFYQVDESMTRKVNGTGLGLAITKLIMKSSKGDISIKSSPGKGTEVILIFPCD